jgi:hypothetical protein
MNLYDPYYAAVVLATTTVAAVLISAVDGNRRGNPLAGVPVLILGVFAAVGPWFFRALVSGDFVEGALGLLVGGLAGFVAGAVVGVLLTAALFAYWRRGQERVAPGQSQRD